MPAPQSRRPLLLLLLITVSFHSVATDAAELIVDKNPSAPLFLQLDPCTATAAPRLCGRVAIRGRSRIRDPSRIFHALSVRVNVSDGDALFRISTIELCLHRNASIPVGMCPASKWQKLTKNAWHQSMSPYDNKILDIRMPPDPSRTVEVSTSEELLFHRVVFLLIGMVMIAMAHILSESVVFYYGGAMTIGIILVVLIVLFQGMRLLPTGRRGSLAIFIYSSIVGMTTFLLHYLSGLLRSALVEIGITEDMHNPIGILLVVCVLLAGAWFGFWGVRKLVLAEDGTIDSSVATFVEWAILIISVVLILQCSLDYIFTSIAVLLAVIIRFISKMDGKTEALHRLVRRIYKKAKKMPNLVSPAKNSRVNYSGKYRSPRSNHASFQASAKVPLQGDGRESYFSTYHTTPERRKFTREEYEAITKEETRKAMVELVSSPDFNQWALANADRISVMPVSSTNVHKRQRLMGWF